MLNTNLETVLKKLNQYNSRIEQSVDKYETDRQIKLIGPQMDGSTLFKGLFLEDGEAIKEKLKLIKGVSDSQQTEYPKDKERKLFNEIKYSMYASHKFLYYATIKYFNNTSRIQPEDNIVENVFYDNRNTQYLFKEKNGISFGTHLTISYEQNQHSKESYFIKAHKNYFVLNDKITGTIESQISSTSIFGSQGKRVGLAPNMDRMDIDFKELFVYKCLERLRFGTEINFFINPYLKKALYIQSKDLNSGGEFNGYKTIQELQEQSTKDPIGQQRDISHFEAQLTEMDIIARSFLLTDMHNDNIMFKIENQNLNQNFNLKIVDFIVPDKDNVKKINDTSFMVILEQMRASGVDSREVQQWSSYYVDKLMGKTPTPMYSLIDAPKSFILADSTLTKYSQNEDRNKIVSETLKKEINIIGKNQKRLAGEEALKLLEIRLNTVGNRLGIKDRLANIMEQAEQDIESFMQQKSFIQQGGKIIKQCNSSLLGLTDDQFTAKMDDLHKYQEGVLENFNSIKEFIESGKEIEDDQQTL